MFCTWCEVSHKQTEGGRPMCGFLFTPHVRGSGMRSVTSHESSQHHQGANPSLPQAMHKAFLESLKIWILSTISVLFLFLLWPRSAEWLQVWSTGAYKFNAGMSVENMLVLKQGRLRVWQVLVSLLLYKIKHCWKTINTVALTGPI